MTTALATNKPQQPQSKPSALALMASRLSCDPQKLLSTLKNTVFRNASDDELMALCLVANEYLLNPLLKEMYAFPAKGGGIVPIVSVDGWNKMLLRQPNFDGIKFAFDHDNDGHPVSCTAIVYIKDRTHPMEITEYFAECTRNTDNWKNMPHRMLRNRTLCQAARMAFGFSGVYHEEEAEAITIEATVTRPDFTDGPQVSAPTPAAKTRRPPVKSPPAPQPELGAQEPDDGDLGPQPSAEPPPVAGDATKLRELMGKLDITDEQLLAFCERKNIKSVLDDVPTTLEQLPGNKIAVLVKNLGLTNSPMAGEIKSAG